jgi:Carboxypeptidase regulatory-like domain
MRIISRFRARMAVTVVTTAILFAPGSVLAQNLLVEVVSAETRAPIAGVMLTLSRVDGQEVVGRALTNGVGKHLFVALPAGRYAVHAEVIGFSTLDQGPVVVDVASTALERLSMDPLAIALEGITVEGQRRCSVRPEEGTRVAAVWEEVRKGLTGVAWTEDEGIYRYRVLKSTSDVDLDTGLAHPVDRSVSSRFLRRPFESREAKDLVETGFVQRAPDGEADLFFAPDAGVLLSDDFLDTHCFRLRLGADDHAGMVGLAFQPTKSQRTPDISGVLWVRLDGWALERADFWYENLPEAARSSQVGGYVRFQRLPNGTSIVPEWEIRMPSLGITRDVAGERRTALIGTRRVLGRVLRVEEMDGTLFLTAEAGTIEGVVLDSLGEAPLAGARVHVEGDAGEIVTDARGAFRATELPSGRYSIEVRLPGAAAVSSAPLRGGVEVEDGEVAFVSFRAPSRAELLAASCRDSGGGLPPRTAVLLGTVHDAGSGVPLPGATVRISWHDIQFAAKNVPSSSSWDYRLLESDRGIEVTTDADGVYHACAIPELTPLTIFTSMARLAATIDTLRIPERAGVFSRDFGLHLSTRGAAGAGAPPPGGAIEVEGLEVRVLSRESREARAAGTAFDRISPQEMEEVRDRFSRVVDVLKALGPPRLQITESGGGGASGASVRYCIASTRQRPSVSELVEWRGRCQPALLAVDGVILFNPATEGVDFESMVLLSGMASELLMSLQPEEIESVRFLQPQDARFRYGEAGKFGALQIETRRGGLRR